MTLRETVPTPTDERTEYLFSYGTLQLESVQLSLFGRTVSGHRDILPRFAHALLKIEDPAEVAALGKTHHAIAKFTRHVDDTVAGTALNVTMDELLNADAYEPPEYQRVRVVLRSGMQAWVHVDVAHAPTAEQLHEIEESAERFAPEELCTRLRALTPVIVAESPTEVLWDERDAR